jgi:hypothetical protein
MNARLTQVTPWRAPVGQERWHIQPRWLQRSHGWSGARRKPDGGVPLCGLHMGGQQGAPAFARFRGAGGVCSPGYLPAPDPPSGQPERRSDRYRVLGR